MLKTYLLHPPPKGRFTLNWKAVIIFQEPREQFRRCWIYWVDAKVSADFFSFLCFKFLLKQNTINQQRIYHCYL